MRLRQTILNMKHRSRAWGHNFKLAKIDHKKYVFTEKVADT